MLVYPLAFAAIAATFTARAKTPDGLTPAVEDVCDDYSGAAYGLCNSYCEAMDCDDPAVRASEMACTQVAANFTKKTGDDLPCESAPEACEVSLRNDVVIAENIGHSFAFNVLANDSVTPADADLYVESVDSHDLVTLTDAATGDFEGFWPEDEPFLDIELQYTACCDADTCASAYIIVLAC